MMAHMDKIKSNLSWFPKPWLLKGEATNDYWRHTYDHWMEHEAKKHAGIPVLPKPDILPKEEAMIKEEKQFSNYWDIFHYEMGETPISKYHYLRMWYLLEWLPAVV